MKKILAIVMAVAMVMALSVTSFAATYDVEISLDNLGYYGATDCTNVTEVDGGLNSSENAISFLLPVEVAMGETVTVTITGSADGPFRVWLANGAGTASNQVYTDTDLGFSGGDFTLECTLTAEDHDGNGISVANAVILKGMSYDAALENVTVTSITLTTEGEAVATTEESSEESSEEVADSADSTETSTETTTSTNADTGVVLAVLPMAVAAAAVVVSKRR